MARHSTEAETPAVAPTGADSELERFAQSLPEPFLIADRSGNILYCNPAAAECLSHWRIRLASEFLPPNHDDTIANCLRGSGTPQEAETIVAGRIVRWLYTPSAQKDRVYINARDMSDAHRKEAEQRVSDEHYRLIAENATDVISRHDKDGVFLYVSPAVTTLLGFRPEELLGISSYDLFHPDDLGALLNKAPSVIYERGFYTTTYRIRRKDGEYTWFETTSRTHRDPGTGELREILCVSRDVTRRIEAEETNKRLASVVEATTDMVAFADVRGRILYLNEAARSQLGVDDIDAAPAYLKDIYSRSSFVRLESTGFATAAERGAWSAEMTLIDHSNGREIATSQVFLAHKNLHKQVEYYSVLARDITERKRAEADAQQRQRELSHTARLATMGEMASGLAHEINQPLAAIVNYAQGTLRRLNAEPGLDGATVRQALERISAQAVRSGEIIKRLRRFIRKGQSHASAFELDLVISDTVALCDWEARQHGIRLAIVPAPLNTRLVADRIQLEQVLVNLIRNAIDAARELDDPDRRTVTITASRGPEAVTVSVLDEGPGIDERELARVFEPFYTTKPNGLGMGLSISRSMVESSGGRLWGRSTPGEGSTFGFTLPQSPSVAKERLQ